jgi:hypothetical protein
MLWKSPLFVAFVGIPGGAVLFAVAFGGTMQRLYPAPKVDFARQEIERCLSRPDMWDRWAKIDATYNVARPHCRDIVPTQR